MAMTIVDLLNGNVSQSLTAVAPELYALVVCHQTRPLIRHSLACDYIPLKSVYKRRPHFLSEKNARQYTLYKILYESQNKTE